MPDFEPYYCYLGVKNVQFLDTLIKEFPEYCSRTQSPFIMPDMKTLLLSLTLLLSTTLAQAACKTMLTLESDDSIYPGRGEVQLCTNNANQITKLIVIKPVQNPSNKDLTSEQADERNPIVHIGLEQINTTTTDIAILTPSRMGIQVKAAVLKVPEKKIDKDRGGEVVLKVIKSKIAGSYHHLRLQLSKERDEWHTYLVEGGSKTPISHFFFRSGVSGIKKIEHH